MRRIERIRLLVLVVLFIGFTGCGQGLQPSDPPAPTPTSRSSASEPRESAPPPAVSLPAGRVPDVVVGRWTGGFGSKTGEYLVIDSDGSYSRGKSGERPYRSGVIVAGGGADFVTYDVDGQRKAGQWEYTNAAGIEVLAVYFGADYYSYVRS